MALAAVPLFYVAVVDWIDFAVLVLSLILMLWAFINAAVQRPDAFAAIGGLQKHHWLGLLGGLFALTLLFFLVGVRFSILIYVGIGAAAYYLLETRRGLKDVSEGSW